MNDFTKDELETIYLDMNHSVLKYGKENVAPFYLELRDKVENMIDNYCEHERHGDFHVCVDKCIKCGDFYK